MAWTNTGGGDHEGAAWTPADTTIIGGAHYNISTFTVTNGYTINIDTGNELEIYANVHSVVGTINGDVKGSAGGGGGTSGVSGSSGTGTGAGVGGGGDLSGAGGGGGAGYGAGGGVGGAGAFGAGGAAGSQYGTVDTTIISMGSGGGGGGGNGASPAGTGGRGGGSIYLSGNTITVSGTVSCDGENGADGAAVGGGGGGGGGSGGGVLLVGGAITVSGTITCTGGNGGSATGKPGEDGGAGGGAGGRIKIVYRTINISGATFTLTAGTGGTGVNNGSAGTIGNHTDTEVKCNSTYAMGQTFTPDTANTGKFYISEVRLWAMAVTVSGKVFTMTVYDDSAKGSNYGSATLTIVGAGEKRFAFEPWIELPDAHDQYYLEVTTPDGDVDFGTEGNEPLSGEDMYFKVVFVERFSMYVRVFGLITVDSPIIYNAADTAVKCNVANVMLGGAIHRINVDGTGTFQYSDDFTTAKYGQDAITAGTVAYDSNNNEVDISASSSIYWRCDCKYPVTGIPTFTAKINITAGTPTIKIAADSGGSPDTWYDITTAIVDDVSTEYELDSSSLSLKGDTVFYVKVDCGAGETASVKSIQVDANMVTIDAEHPVVTTGSAASTFRCDQNADSGMSCTVALYYRDRSWPA